MAGGRQRKPTWKSEVLLSLAEKPRPFDDVPERRSLVELRCGYDEGFGALLEWLRSARLQLDVARVLAPGGLLIVTALGPRPGLRGELGRALARSADAWSLLHASLAEAEFTINEEHLGASRLLVAQKRLAGYRTFEAC